MNWDRPNHSGQLHILRNMINMFEAHTEREEDFTDNDKQFLYAVSRWFETRPTRCYGYDSATKCGRPTVPDQKGHRRIGSVCFECRQKAWEKSAPPLSKREQRSMDSIEAVFKEQQKAILPTNEEQRVFQKKLSTFWNKINGNDLMRFHYEQLAKKYHPPVNDSLTTEEATL